MPVEVAFFGRPLHSGGTLYRDACPFLLKQSPAIRSPLRNRSLRVRLYQSRSRKVSAPVTLLKAAAYPYWIQMSVRRFN